MKHNKQIFCPLAAAALMLSPMASLPIFGQETVQTTQGIHAEPQEDTSFIVYDANAQYPSHRANVLTPDFYIFAGPMDEASANALIQELGMEQVLKESGGKVSVVSPLEGDTYTSADLKAYEDIIQQAPINNIKMIGIGAGADFLTNIAAPKVNYAAGMMIVDGDSTYTGKTGEPIPVYLSHSSAATVAYFTEANSKASPEPELQKTIVHAEEETLAEAFANAWNEVFRQNYRSSNSVVEFYNAPAMLAKGVDILEWKYDLTSAPVLDVLNVEYHEQTHQTVKGMSGSDYAWFEYIPASVKTAADGTVPLIVSIHGNQNDPRLQGDSSGWVELAAKEGFMVVSPEYQTAEENAFFTQLGNTNIYGTVDGLGADGIVKLVAQLQETYPQIDASRIYVTGLSQGGAMTSYLGVYASDVFAAAASVSGVNVFRDRIADTMNGYDGPEVAYMYMCGDRDFFQMIPVDGSSVHGTQELYDFTIWEEGTATDIYSIFNAYQQANGLDVTPMDMSLNPYYGIALDDWHQETLGDRTMHTGTLSNDKGIVMKLVAIENQAHWNYKPEAQMMWDFFQCYSRDPQTHELIISGENAKETPGWKQQQDDTWEYVLEDGTSAVGWRWIDGKWYHFNTDHTMSAKTWISYKGHWYFVDSTGAMKENAWLKWNGAWYYLGTNGVMAAQTSVDGYWLNANGVWEPTGA